MKLFFLKFISIIAIMFFCVLLGIHYAHKGIESTRGYTPFEIEEVTKLSNEATLERAESKKNEDLPVESEQSIFSSAGKKLADIFTNLSVTLLELISDLLKQILF